MALAIASGVPPQHGLYTAIVAGGLVALTGGSRLQVSGPTAAFVIVLAPISAKFGLGGLAIASLMAGLLLVMMGLGKLGRIIQFVPYPVTVGFTAGIAVVIAVLQVRDFLGLAIPQMPSHFPARVAAMAAALPTLHWSDLTVGLFTLAVLLIWPRLTQRVPSALPALLLAAAGAWILHQFWPAFAVDTIATRFTYDAGGVVGHGIPSVLPTPGFPWKLPAADGSPIGLSWSLLAHLSPFALTIAMLGAIESLLSAVIADGMAGDRHDPDAELIGQGLGNIAAPLLGGFAATGALARTATNIRSGARSPLAAVFHAVFVLAAVLLLARLLGLLPMASLAALLLVVAWNMSEARHVLRTIRTAPRGDVLVLLVCMGLTVMMDMVVAVTVGFVLASVLFMRRMADVSNVRLVSGEAAHRDHRLPAEVLLYEVRGPLFFGAAAKAMDALHSLHESIKVVIFDLHGVPVIDATGLVNLESALARLRKSHVWSILVGLQPQPAQAVQRHGIASPGGQVFTCHSLEEAHTLARLLGPNLDVRAPSPDNEPTQATA